MTSSKFQRIRPRVAIADDHPHMLQAVVAALEDSCEIVATVADGQAAVEAVSSAAPDVVVLDISMPVLSGLGAALHMAQLGLRAKVVFLTVYEDPGILRAAQAAGGRGFVIKSRLDTDLAIAIQDVMQGRPFVSPGIIENWGSDRPETPAKPVPISPGE